MKKVKFFIITILSLIFHLVQQKLHKQPTKASNESRRCEKKAAEKNCMFLSFFQLILPHTHTHKLLTHLLRKKYTLDFNKYKYKKIFLRLTTTTINNTTTLTKRKRKEIISTKDSGTFGERR